MYFYVCLCDLREGDFIVQGFRTEFRGSEVSPRKVSRSLSSSIITLVVTLLVKFSDLRGLSSWENN